MNTLRNSLALVLALCLCSAAGANESRTFSRISSVEPLPPGALRVNDIQPVRRDVLERAVANIAAQWNTANLEEVLAEEFYDGQRLEDTVLSVAPRDATLRVLSIQGQQVLQQYLLEGTRYSRVSVTVRTQVEFTDNSGAFQRRDGTAEWLLKVTERTEEAE